MTTLNFTSDEGYAGQGATGLIVLDTDETIEPELGPLFQKVTNLYHSRIPFDAVVSPEALGAMAEHLPNASRLLSKDIKFDVIGYGCTSASTVIGSEKVAELVQTAHPEAKVTDPLRSVVAAAQALNAKKIGFLTPYRADVSKAMWARLEEFGFEISSFASFDEEEDHKVALISEASVLDGMKHVAEGADVVFSACTNLRSFNVIEPAEEACGIPVLSSNAALAWHMSHLAGQKVEGPGQLFSLNA